MDTFTPAQLEAFTGLKVGSQRSWDSNGLFMNFADRTEGGQRRFGKSAVLFVAAVRAMADMGFELSISAQVVSRCLPEIASSIDGRPLSLGEAEAPYIFIWKKSDTTRQGHELLQSQGLHIAHEGEFEFLRLADLNRIPFFSKAGGSVVVPSALADRIPDAVKDLFRGDQE